MRRLLIVLIVLSGSAHGETTSLPSDTQIILQRWGCFGTCPVYKLAISADGSVVYDGKAYVHAKGVRRGKISRTELAALVRKFEDANFFSLSGGDIVIDEPIRMVSLALNGRRKELEEGCSCVPELIRLENEVDKAARSEKWVRGRLSMFLHWPWIHL